VNVCERYLLRYLAKLHLQQVTCSLALSLYWPRVNRPEEFSFAALQSELTAVLVA
jgi:hypothetical protein